MSSVDQRAALGVGGRYAKALFDVAEDKGLQSRVGEELALFARLLEDNGDLKRAMTLPFYSKAQKIAILKDLAARLSLSPVLVACLEVLVGNGRFASVGDIAYAYGALSDAKRGAVSGDVVSAAPLSDQVKGALEDALGQALGKTVSLKAEVDSGLLGGFWVKVGSQMVDYSLRAKLETLKMAMKGSR